MQLKKYLLFFIILLSLETTILAKTNKLKYKRSNSPHIPLSHPYLRGNIYSSSSSVQKTVPDVNLDPVTSLPITTTSSRQLQHTISRLEYHPQIADDDVSGSYILQVRFANKLMNKLSSSLSSSSSTSEVSSSSSSDGESASTSSSSSVIPDENINNQEIIEEYEDDGYDDDDKEEGDIDDDDDNTYYYDDDDDTKGNTFPKSSTSSSSIAQTNNHDDRILFPYGNNNIDQHNIPSTDISLSSTTSSESPLPSYLQSLQYFMIHYLHIQTACSNKIFLRIITYSFICTLSILSGLILLYTITIPSRNTPSPITNTNEKIPTIYDEKNTNYCVDNNTKDSMIYPLANEPINVICTVDCDVQYVIPQYQMIHIQ